MIRLLRVLADNHRGATAVDYSRIATLIAVAAAQLFLL
jgi:Flp pilus assembly pilin Flp